MNKAKFEGLTRAVGAAATRRQAAARLGLGLAAGVAPVLVSRFGTSAEEIGPDGQIIPGCRLVGQRCNQRKDCCTNRCAKSQKQCQCLAKGKSCLMTLKGGISFPVHANCCTNRCDNKNRCR